MAPLTLTAFPTFNTARSCIFVVVVCAKGEVGTTLNMLYDNRSRVNVQYFCVIMYFRYCLPSQSTINTHKNEYVMPALNSCIFITCRYISDLKVLIYYFCCQHLRVCTTVIRRRGVAHGFIKFLISAVSAKSVVCFCNCLDGQY